MGKWELWTEEIKDAPAIPKVFCDMTYPEALYEILEIPKHVLYIIL